MGSSKIIAPPPGFVLDEPLPEGFVIDQPKGQPQELSIWRQIQQFMRERTPDDPWKWNEGPNYAAFNQGLREQAPIAGMLIGGAAGAPFGPPGMAAGAGMGGYAGSLVSKPGDILSALKEGLLGATGEAAAPTIIKGLEAVARPIMRGGARALETVTEALPTGKPVLDYFRRKGVGETQEQAARFVAEKGTEKPIGVVGKEFDDALVEAKANFWKDSSGKYDEFLARAGRRKELVDITALRQDMHKILTPEKNLPESVRDAKLVDFLEDVIDRGARYISPKELHEIQKRIRHVGIRNGGQERFLKESIDKTWDDFGGQVVEDVLGSLKDARGHFRGGMEGLIENPLIERLLRDQAQFGSVPYRKVITELFRPENIPAIRKAQGFLPTQSFEEAKRGFISNFFDVDSPVGSRVIREVGEFKDVIDGKELLKQITKNKEIFSAFFDKGTLAALEKLGELAKSTFRGAKVLEKGGGLLSPEGVIRLGALGAVGHYAGPEVAVGAAGLAPIIARSLMSNSGYLKRVLTSGMTIPTGTRRVLEMGGKAAIMNIGREMTE